MAWSAQKKGQSGVVDAASKILPVGANRRQRVEDGVHQSRQIAALTVGELLLGQLPDSLVRIELRRVRWEALQMEAPGLGTELADQQATMGIAAVPKNEDMAVEVSEQLSQEVARLQLSDVVGVELKVEVEPLADGRNRDPRDGRDAVTPIEVMDRRRHADGSPGGGDGRCQLESRFIDEDEVGSQPLGVFFTAGQSRRRKRRISAWLRSSALFCGFWWLHPSECRSLPTWSR